MLLRWIITFYVLQVFFQSSFARNNTIDHWETVVMANDTWHYFVGFNIGPPLGLAESRF